VARRPGPGTATAPTDREEKLGRDFPDYQLGALPPLRALVGANVYVDPEVLGHDTVVFAAGIQTESVKMQTQELFGTGEITTVTLVAAGARQRPGCLGRWGLLRRRSLTTRWSMAWGVVPLA
jgi:hypothetical protein